MNVELQDLRWAITASQHPSLRRAAETLNVRQSTLSRRLRDLEFELGATLFERTNGGTRVTVAGQEFLDAARRIIDDTDVMLLRLRTRSRGESGRLTIGVHSSLSTGNLKATLLEHHRKFPNVLIHLVDGSSDHLISDLGSSAIDVAFVAEEITRWDSKVLTVWSERVVVALPEDHPLRDHNPVRWHELIGERLLVPQRGPGQEFLDLLSRKMGCLDPCHVLRQDAGLDRLLTLVGVKQGILLALEGATGTNYPGVVYREVHDHEGATRLSFRAYWRSVNGNPSLPPFLQLLFERYPSLSLPAVAP
jgi:DNA-binding transcriptional LysR family regulator